MKKRLVVKAVCKGHGSEARSGLCPLETGCVYFDVNGVEMVAFAGKNIQENMFKYGKEYDLSFFLSDDDHRTMRYPMVLR